VERERAPWVSHWGLSVLLIAGSSVAQQQDRFPPSGRDCAVYGPWRRAVAAKNGRTRPSGTRHFAPGKKGCPYSGNPVGTNCARPCPRPAGCPLEALPAPDSVSAASEDQQALHLDTDVSCPVVHGAMSCCVHRPLGLLAVSLSHRSVWMPLWHSTGRWLSLCVGRGGSPHVTSEVTPWLAPCESLIWTAPLNPTALPFRCDLARRPVTAASRTCSVVTGSSETWVWGCEWGALLSKHKATFTFTFLMYPCVCVCVCVR
jgi:hypothetical protein